MDEEISLVLYRPSPHSNIWLVDEHTGKVYGVTRGWATANLLWSLGNHELRRGTLKPLKDTKQIVEVERSFRAQNTPPVGYVRTVIGWEAA